ncbi:MAG: polysaccharide biosynthesis/export family protein, partial [Algoriphagus sp.]
FIFLAFMGCLVPEAIAQEMNEADKIKVDQLSDVQIQDLLDRAYDAGLSKAEFLKALELQGMPPSEVAKMRVRINEQEESGRSTKISKRDAREQEDMDEIALGMFQFSDYSPQIADPNEIFGTSLFYQKNRRLSFEPSLNQATPKSYVLGPGDLIYVDIYGQSEQYYEATVNPDGFVLLDNIGPVNVSGKSIEEATGILKNRIGKYYTGLLGSNPTTFLQVTLGNVGSIKVNILGEVRLPGTFTLSAFSTVFNALYAAGGPSENGSMRKIKLMRNSKQIAEIDVYDLLINGTAQLDLKLQDQDVILVPPYISHVKITGEVKRPMVFEATENDNFSDLLRYAGGFTDQAFRDRVAISRITGNQRSVSDVYQNQFDMFLLKGGDEITVQRILDRYSNRVQIKGAVYRAGTFALEEGLTLSQLVKNAEGLRGDAYTTQASIL